MPKFYTIVVALFAVAVLASPIASAAAPAARTAAPAARPAAEATSNARTTITPVTKAESKRLLKGLKPADEISPRLSKIKAAIQELRNRRATKKSQTVALRKGLAETNALARTLAKLRKGFEVAEQRIGLKGGQAAVDDTQDAIDALRSRLEDAQKTLESEDKLDNFEIQVLMSRFNQAATTASAVKKKAADTENAVIQKIS